MPSNKFELTDISDPNYTSETNLTMTNSKSGKNGCFISIAVGIVLVVVAALLAVVVGLIVFFAADGRDVVCNCGASSGGGAVTSAAIKQQCIDLAEKGDTEICNKCSPPATTSSPMVTTASLASTTAQPMVIDVRLPGTLMPVHYDVRLQPDMHHADPADFTFKGSVRVILECRQATNKVILHINVLKIDDGSIHFEGVAPLTSDPSFVNYELDLQRQFLIINLDKSMQDGRTYAVNMTFTSPLKDDLKGLYYSSYTRGNQTIYLATTQLQPTDARKTFPCMDEPALKATFNITLVRPKDRISISNMPIIDNSTTWTEDGIEYVADVYQRTPKMSTYLLAFIVCDFEYTEGKTSRNVQYRAWSRPEAKESTRYSLQAGIDILTYFEDYFEIDYPLPKQDMIAIPDFAAGAMENWGLITYRETAMLYQPGVSNQANKERVAIVVAHELAHQWFGDLVTPLWWDDLWLNEGFASFVEYMGVDHIHPEWEMFEKFVSSDVHDVLDFDSLISSHPIYVPVANPDQINEIFDRISYGKGASIIRMMRHFLGFETFRKGVVRYLKQKSYEAAFHDDLWEALTIQAQSESKDINVKEVMDTWTLQMNYPLVIVTRDFNNLGQVQVSQERYLINRDAEDPGKYISPFDYKWSIPITLTSSANPRFDHTDKDVHWMYKTETSKYINIGVKDLPVSGDANGWILANVQQNGFYRVTYQLGNWIALSNQLKRDHTVITVINRAQIINDAWSLTKSDDLGLETALLTIEYLQNERSYIPWTAAVIQLNYVEDMLSLTSAYGAFQRFMRNKTEGTYQYFGLNNTGSNHTDILARSLIVGQACKYGVKDCLEETETLFQQWMTTPDVNMIDPNLKSTVYCNGVRNGDWAEWEFAMQMYLKSTNAGESARLLSAMSCTKKPWILSHYMNLLLRSDSPVRKQDALTVISNIGYSTVGQPLAWNFFRANYNYLKATYGNSFFSWTRLIGRLTAAFNTEFSLNEIKEFMNSKLDNLGTGKRAFEQALEETRSNIKWMKKNLAIIDAWLKKNNY